MAESGRLGEGGRRAVAVFTAASVCMWVLPIGVLVAFNRNAVPGAEAMSPRTKTLWSGGLAVLSVNAVIFVFIVLALREPPAADRPQPDPAFAGRAKAMLAQFAPTPRPPVSDSAAESSDKKVM